MSKTKHPANIVLLTESEQFVHISALLIVNYQRPHAVERQNTLIQINHCIETSSSVINCMNLIQFEKL